MDETRAAHIDGSGEESHTKRLLMSDTLESADEICALKILGKLVSVYMRGEVENEPWIRGSIGLAARPWN